jgi:hypothetical protein
MTMTPSFRRTLKAGKVEGRVIGMGRVLQVGLMT